MVCGLYVNEMPILEWYMAKLVVINGHMKTCVTMLKIGSMW